MRGQAEAGELGPERRRWCLVGGAPAGGSVAGMWPVFWVTVRGYLPYVTFPVAFVVGAVGYHLEWLVRGRPPPPTEEEKSIWEKREERTLEENSGKDLTQVVSLKDKLEFAPRAVLNRNRPEKN
ncbi:hypothetical protein JRQ81_011919 [Phrynocephalus forsythii]|uniref:Small integral membrane protein 12 n=1 Tax=Phrynocephalus forsythii TaxID=171643 RepID=A0A9Q0X6Q5_9SAUR|nr:hypothetical protein JRQ81_011919 [Phrynocephalus forsythii]